MIIVTGANGRLGNTVVAKLLERVDPERIGVSVRAPQQTQGLAERGVRVRRGDFAEPASLRHAFEGASQVLVVSVDSTGETAVRQHRAAIEAATAAGAGRILYTSHMGVNPSSPFPPMRDHAATEAALRESGTACTALRNGFYPTTPLQLLDTALQTGELAVPEDGPVAWTAHTDLAEAAAVALTENDLGGATANLTGPTASDMAGIAAIASELTGRTIRRVVLSDDEYRTKLLAHGVPEPAADMMLGLFAASRQGDFAQADPALATMTDRPPASLRDLLQTAITAPR